MGCSLVSAITFMCYEESRKICAYYFGCILVRFDRVSCRTDGTRSWEPHGLAKASGQALAEHISAPQQGIGRRITALHPLVTLLLLPQRVYLTAFTSRVSDCPVFNL